MPIHELSKNDISCFSNKIIINNLGPGILLIWGNYCGFCHEFLPTYEELSNKIDNRFKVCSIEVSNMPANMSKLLKMQGVPSLYFFDNSGKIIAEYDGPDRKLKTLEEHICKVYHYCKRQV